MTQENVNERIISPEANESETPGSTQELQNEQNETSEDDDSVEFEELSDEDEAADTEEE